MNGREFIELVEQDYDVVAVRVNEPGNPLHGRIFTCKKVVDEFHEDTKTWTGWIEVTEY